MKQITQKILLPSLTLVMMLVTFNGCSATTQTSQTQASTPLSNQKNVPVVGNLEYQESLPLEYAKCFNVDYFKDGYLLLTIEDTQKFLVVPENQKAPAGLNDDITVLQRPFTGVYAANTPSVSLINAIGALDQVQFTGTDTKDWYIKEVAAAMTAGTLTFGGKYNTPDYEKLTAANCNLTIQSGMLDGVPDVKDKFKELGIPVLIDRSGDEAHPLARIEWLKFYAALLDVDMTVASEAFAAQTAVVDKLSKAESTGKTVAIIYISSKGQLYVRNTDDYVTKMVEMAGGKYIYDQLANTGSNSTTIEMEEFYKQAKEVDYILYMYSLGGKPSTLKELVEKNELLKDFKAVKEGHVWATCPEFFQVGDVLGYMIGDINTMLTTQDSSITQLDYINKLQ